MYDHTIESLPEENEKFLWHKIGLTGKFDEATEDLGTLPDFIQKNGHDNETDMILKVDIEGAEYDVFANLDEAILKKFRQIVIEFHKLTDPSMKEKITTAVSNLNKTHQLVHIHANNWGHYSLCAGKLLPELLECTYVNKDNYQFVDNTRSFPTILDQPNNIRRPDVFLGRWND